MGIKENHVERVVKRHKSRKTKSMGKVYLPEEWIGKEIVIMLKSKFNDLLKKIKEGGKA